MHQAEPQHSCPPSMPVTEPASRVAETVRPPARLTEPALDMMFPEREPRTNERLMTRLLNQTRNAEERYRALFESASDAITILTTDGVVLEANPRWEAVLGISPQAMIGRHIREFAAPGRERKRRRVRRCCQ
jgi:PAS domain-containing protein